MPTSDLAAAARALGRGDIVCIPTETTYGLAVDALDADAVEAVAALKGRGEQAPIAVIAGDVEQARSILADWPPVAAELAARHWPGPLTLVIAAADGLSPRLFGPLGVGVRVSSHPWCRKLALALGRPITATSANPAGEPPATSVEMARAYFGDRVSVYLDGGPSTAGPPSTVVAIDGDGAVQILRAGAIGADQITE